MKRNKTAPTPSRGVTIVMPSDVKNAEEITSLTDNPVKRYFNFSWISSGLPDVSICDAVKRNLSDELLLLLRGSIRDDCHQQIRDNFLIHEAVKKNTPTILFNLLEYANQEIASLKNSNRKTALHLAVELNNLECSEVLMRKYPDTLIDDDKFGNTPLHYIAKLGFLGGCQKAVQFGRPNHFNVMNKKHEMPVHIAAIENKIQIIQLFLQNGAKSNPKNKLHYTPLHYACENGFFEIVKVIVNSVECEETKVKIINDRTKAKSTAFIIAAMKGYRACCVELKGADPNLQDSAGCTALHYAARKGYYSIVKHLLNLNAKIDITDNNGQTVLYHAACGPNDEVLDLLLKRIGTVDNATAQKLLHVVCKKNYDGCLKVLLQRGNIAALINHAPECNSLLHISLKKTNYKISKLLLDMGADKNICNQNEEYPLHLAAEQNKLKSRVAEEDRQYVCKIIIQNSHELTHKVNHKNETPLHLAAKSGNTEMIRSLIKKGAIVLAKDNRKFTPIHVAAESGQQDGLKRLIKEITPEKSKELIEMKPHPLHLAAQNGHLNCCEIIIKELKMRTLAVTDDNEMFPVDVAYKAKKFATFRYLLSVMNFDDKHTEFCYRLHDYCEKSILEKRTKVFEAVIDSSWFAVAFDGCYCANIHEPLYGLKPCQSFARLSKSYPESACRLMDKFITKPANESNKEVHCYIPFEFIYYDKGDTGTTSSPFSDISPYKLKESSEILDDSMWGRDHPLMESSSTEDYRVLTHRLTKSWLENKFSNYIGKFLYIYMLIDFVTAIIITVMFSMLWNSNHLRDDYRMTTEFVCSRYDTNEPQSNYERTIYNEVMENNSNCSSYCDNFVKCNKDGSNDDCLGCSICVGYKLSLKSYYVITLQLLAVLLFIFNLVIEIMFIKIYKERRTPLYCISPVRQLRLICLLIILIPTSQCELLLGIRNVVQWQFGVICVLVAWLSLISTLNKVPVLSVFMPFNKKFFLTYLKIVLHIGLLLIAFALCFQFLLPTQKAFQSIPYSLIKSLVWMLGDLGYDDTFLPDGKKLDYPLLSNFIFVIFILGIGSFVFNMLIRDSVDVIDSVKDKSVFYQANASLQLHLLIDDCFPSCRKKHATARKEIICGTNHSTVFYSELHHSQLGPKYSVSVGNTDNKKRNTQSDDDNSLIGDNLTPNETLNLILKKLNTQNEEVVELSKRFGDLKNQINGSGRSDCM